MTSQKSIVYSKPHDLVAKEIGGVQKEKNGSLGEMLCYVKLQKIDEPKIKKKFRCSLCRSSFTYKKSFAKHVSNNHCQKSSSVVVSNDKENIPILIKNRRCLKQNKPNDKIIFPILRIKRCVKPSASVLSAFTPTSNLPSPNDEIIFTCNACKVKIYGQKEYEKHYTQFHGSGIGVIRCSHCPARLNTKESLFWHLQTYHFKLQTYKCPNCDIITCSKKILVEHMRTHKCPNCDIVTCSKKSLVEHMEGVHQEFKCRACDCIYNSEDELINHFENVHFKMVVEPNC